jgi:hypothetical protein
VPTTPVSKKKFSLRVQIRFSALNTSMKFEVLSLELE